MGHHIPKQPTHNKGLAKIKNMTATKAIATNRVMANSTEPEVSNNDNATGYTSMEQILDTARRADRDHYRRESFPIGDSTVRSMKEFWKGSIKNRKVLCRPKANIEVITEQVKELECKNTDLMITQDGLDSSILHYQCTTLLLYSSILHYSCIV